MTYTSFRADRLIRLTLRQTPDRPQQRRLMSRDVPQRPCFLIL